MTYKTKFQSLARLYISKTWKIGMKYQSPILILCLEYQKHRRSIIYKVFYSIANDLSRFLNIETLVRTGIPHHNWDHEKFALGPSFAPQSYLQRIVRSMFPPGTKLLRNVRSGHGIVGPSGSPLEIDIFLPDHKLGFEYQVLKTVFYSIRLIGSGPSSLFSYFLRRGYPWRISWAYFSLMSFLSYKHTKNKIRLNGHLHTKKALRSFIYLFGGIGM